MRARATKRWNDLDPGVRRLIVVSGAFEGVLKVAALIDLARRPSAEVRAAKARWAAAIILINSAGAVPLLYFRYGRRKSPEAAVPASRGTARGLD